MRGKSASDMRQEKECEVNGSRDRYHGVGWDSIINLVKDKLARSGQYERDRWQVRRRAP